MVRAVAGAGAGRQAGAGATPKLPGSVTLFTTDRIFVVSSSYTSTYWNIMELSD
jgi:hypothetical protein